MEVMETTDGDKVTTSVTASARELQMLKFALGKAITWTGEHADRFESDDECKAAIAEYSKFINKMENAQKRIVKKRVPK